MYKQKASEGRGMRCCGPLQCVRPAWCGWGPASRRRLGCLGTWGGGAPLVDDVSICWTLAWISRLVVKPTTKIDKDVPD